MDAGADATVGRGIGKNNILRQIAGWLAVQRVALPCCGRSNVV